MPIAFAISVLVLVWLTETLGQGLFGMNALDTISVTHIAAAAFAVLILRSDVLELLRRPAEDVYGSPRLVWTYSRTTLALFIGGAVVLVPLIMAMLGELGMQRELSPLMNLPSHEIQRVLFKALALALAAELFFREAAVKAFSSNIGAMMIASTLAYFVFRMSDGLPAAIVAAGAGMYFLTLRLVGSHVIMIAIIHAVFSVFLAFFVPDLASNISSAIQFTVAMALLSLTVFIVLAPKQIELSHA